MQQLTEATHA